MKRLNINITYEFTWIDWKQNYASFKYDTIHICIVTNKNMVYDWPVLDVKIFYLMSIFAEVFLHFPTCKLFVNPTFFIVLCCVSMMNLISCRWCYCCDY